MPLNRIPVPSPNYSSRSGATVRLIVLHTAQGAANIADLGAFFANPASGVSSHVGIDDTPNTVGEYVRRDYKSWCAAGANPVAVQAELCAWAEWDNATWNTHMHMLANTAAWIAEEAAHFGIPIVALTAAEAQNGAAGVCQHADLGAWGGGHWDCGPGFPMGQVIAMAGGGEPIPPLEELDMIAAPCVFPIDDSQQVFYVDDSGRLRHYYWRPGKPWVGETLSAGWDPDTGLAHTRTVQNTEQVWGVLADGRRAQVYWSGKAWVTQPL